MKLHEKTCVFMQIVAIFRTCKPFVLAMGTAPASDAFQRRLSNLEIDAKPKPPKCFISNVLAVLDRSHDKHLLHVDNIFKILKEAGLQMNLKKSALGHAGFWLMSGRYWPAASRTHGALDANPLKSKKDNRMLGAMMNLSRTTSKIEPVFQNP